MRVGAADVEEDEKTLSEGRGRQDGPWPEALRR